jgi:alginate O-acetyltransferase complex protein AlgI
MIFTSAFFCEVLGVTFAAYYLPALRRWQPLILVAASLVIYWKVARPSLALLMSSAAFIGAVTHWVAQPDGTRRRRLAMLGVGVTLLILGFYKYRYLLIPGLAASAPAQRTGLLESFLYAALPAGISFYTFHGISLIVDTYRDPKTIGGPRPLAGHLVRSFLYITFFPQLVAGPIVKGKAFFPQIVPKRLAGIDWRASLDCLICGYFLKLVLADNLQHFTQPMTDPGILQIAGSFQLFAMMIAYSAQIFADFAGYSLIAIGTAKLFGYDLPQNFNNPYLSASFAEFWRRWHMSLSAWLRDYLYIPLGGNRRGALRTYANLFIVMLLGGLWHGADWKYAAWGVWHGAALMAERALGHVLPALPEGRAVRLLSALFVFAYVTFGWLLFKLDSFGTVVAYLERMAQGVPAEGVVERTDTEVMLIVAALALVYQIASEWLRDRPASGWLAELRPLALGAMLVFILFGQGEENAFIYFQF